MRVLVAGGTGAVGRALVPELANRGHVVAALSRCPDAMSTTGAVSHIAADAFDREAIIAVFTAFQPEIVIHQLTALPRATSLFRFDRDFAETNALRTTGTDILIEAARAFGARRLIAQSFCGWPFARTGGPVKTEADPFDPDPPAGLRTTLAGLRRLEASIVEASDLQGAILRYGSFYGPGTHLCPGSSMAKQVRKRRLQIVGNGEGVWSFSHIDDVATGTAIAAEAEPIGIYNLVDDDPAEVRIWLPNLAAAMGARPPRHLPGWLAQILLPEHLRVMMTEVRGGSNEKFKRVFDWAPRYPSWRQGFASLFRTAANG